MRQVKLGVIGLGSLGSLTTVQLAMSGVQNFVLIDPDILEDNNIVRHAADLRYVGMSKVLAVKDLILNRNSEATVNAISANVMDCTDALHDVDFVLVAGLGSEIVTTNVALKIRELNKIALFSGIYEKAVAGEVFIVHPTIGPCYSCFASRLRSSEPQIQKDVDYGLPIDELKAQPGLGSHIVRVSSVFADWTLRLAIHDSNILPYFPGNLVILSNEAYNFGNDKEGNALRLPPSSAKWLTIKKLHKCNICSPPDFLFESFEELEGD